MSPSAIRHDYVLYIGAGCVAAGGFIAHKLMDARYEVHSLFLPEGRGGLAIECAREGLAFMFCATDCAAIRRFRRGVTDGETRGAAGEAAISK